MNTIYNIALTISWIALAIMVAIMVYSGIKRTKIKDYRTPPKLDLVGDVCVGVVFAGSLIENLTSEVGWVTWLFTILLGGLILVLVIARRTARHVKVVVVYDEASLDERLVEIAKMIDGRNLVACKGLTHEKVDDVHDVYGFIVSSVHYLRQSETHEEARAIYKTGRERLDNIKCFRNEYFAMLGFLDEAYLMYDPRNRELHKILDE